MAALNQGVPAVLNREGAGKDGPVQVPSVIVHGVVGNPGIEIARAERDLHTGDLWLSVYRFMFQC